MTVSFLYLLLFRLNLRVFLRLELAAKIREHRARMAHAMPQTISAVEAKPVGMIMIVEASTMPMTA